MAIDGRADFEPQVIIEPFPEPDDHARDIPVRRWFLAASLVALNLLDIALTKWILSLGGEERNPIMAPIIHHPAAPIVVKLGLALLVGGLVLIAPRTSKIADAAMILAVGVYTAVIGWNIAVLIEGLQATRI